MRPATDSLPMRCCGSSEGGEFVSKKSVFLGVYPVRRRTSAWSLGSRGAAGQVVNLSYKNVPSCLGRQDPRRDTGSPTDFPERCQECLMTPKRVDKKARPCFADRAFAFHLRKLTDHPFFRNPRRWSTIANPAGLSPMLFSSSMISEAFFSSSTCSLMNHWSMTCVA